MSQAQNIRRAWLAERIGSTDSDAKLVELGAGIFKVTEATMRSDLKAIYERWAEIDAENAPMHKARFMELGMAILAACRDAGAKSFNYSSTVSQFKTLAQIAGVLSDGSRGGSGVDNSSTQPSDNAIKSRIEKLSKDPKIRERALKLGLDLDDPDLLVSGDNGETTTEHSEG